MFLPSLICSTENSLSFWANDFCFDFFLASFFVLEQESFAESFTLLVALILYHSLSPLFRVNSFFDSQIHSIFSLSKSCWLNRLSFPARIGFSVFVWFEPFSRHQMLASFDNDYDNDNNSNGDDVERDKTHEHVQNAGNCVNHICFELIYVFNSSLFFFLLAILTLSLSFSCLVYFCSLVVLQIAVCDNTRATDALLWPQYCKFSFGVGNQRWISSLGHAVYVLVMNVSFARIFFPLLVPFEAIVDAVTTNATAIVATAAVYLFFFCRFSLHFSALIWIYYGNFPSFGPFN